MINIRAFRAIDEPHTCQRFLDGHRKVLEEFNIENISTNTPKWIRHPNTYVVIGEYEGELLGGIRVQIADGEFPLPVEDAVGDFDPKIHDLVGKYMEDNGASELCGLWNSRKFAPNWGITMLLSVAAVSICDQIGVKNLFAICAGYTLRSAMRVGFQVEREVGNNGEFIYPNSNFVARVLSMNCLSLATTNAQYTEEINSLRQDRNKKSVIQINNQVLNVEYDLTLKAVTPFLLQKH
jgi:hypothetical protein